MKTTRKSRKTAVILAFIAGWFGLHRFYLRQLGLGILYAILLFSGISILLGLIDAIFLLLMDDKEFDRKYNSGLLREKYGISSKYNPPQPIKSKKTNRSGRSLIKKWLRAGKDSFTDYDYHTSIKYFEKILEKDPSHSVAHFNLACCYSLLEDIDSAYAHLSSAVKCGFDNFKEIKEHPALAYMRVQPGWNLFMEGGYSWNENVKSAKIHRCFAGKDRLLDELKRLEELRKVKVQDLSTI